MDRKKILLRNLFRRKPSKKCQNRNYKTPIKSHKLTHTNKRIREHSSTSYHAGKSKPMSKIFSKVLKPKNQKSSSLKKKKSNTNFLTSLVIQIEKLSKVAKAMSTRNNIFKNLLAELKKQISLDPIFEIQVSIIDQLVDNYSKLETSTSAAITKLKKNYEKARDRICSKKRSKINLDMSKIKLRSGRREEQLYTPNFGYSREYVNSNSNFQKNGFSQKSMNSIESSFETTLREKGFSDISADSKYEQELLNSGCRLSSFTDGEKLIKNKKSKRSIPRLNLDIKLSLESDDRFEFQDTKSFYQQAKQNHPKFDLKLNQSLDNFQESKKKRGRKKTKTQNFDYSFKNKKMGRQRGARFSKRHATRPDSSKTRKMFKKKNLKQMLSQKKSNGMFERFKRSANLLFDSGRESKRGSRVPKNYDFRSRNLEGRRRSEGWKHLLKSFK